VPLSLGGVHVDAQLETGVTDLVLKRKTHELRRMLTQGASDGGSPPICHLCTRSVPSIFLDGIFRPQRAGVTNRSKVGVRGALGVRSDLFAGAMTRGGI
jgi:hypothetical protein